MDSAKESQKLDLEYEISKNIRKLNNYYGDIYIKNWTPEKLVDIENRLSDITYQVNLLKELHK